MATSIIPACHMQIIENNGATTTLNNNTATELNSITLPAGQWLVLACVRFASNATGYRQATISTTTATVGTGMFLANVVPAVDGTNTFIYISTVLSPTESTTYYLNALQNSGGQRTGNYGHLKAIKIS